MKQLLLLSMSIMTLSKASFALDQTDPAKSNLASSVTQAPRYFERLSLPQGLNDLRDKLLCECFFDCAFYLNSYPEVKATNIDPLDHYLIYGWKEEKLPRPGFSDKVIVVKLNNDKFGMVSGEKDMIESNYQTIVDQLNNQVTQQINQSHVQALKQQVQQPVVTTRNEVINTEYGQLELVSNVDYLSNEARQKAGKVDAYLSDFALDFILKDAPDFDVIDIGPHIGTFALPLAKNIKGTVHAFEAQKEIADILNRNKQRNHFNNLSIYNTVLSDRDGKTVSCPVIDYPSQCNTASVSFWEDIGRVSSNQAAQVYRQNVNNGQKTTHITKTLDFYNLKNIGLIKIDTEGMELEILKGAVQTLKNNNYPVLLFDAWNFTWYNQKRNELFNFIKSLGYKIQHLQGDDYYAVNAKFFEGEKDSTDNETNHKKENFDSSLKAQNDKAQYLGFHELNSVLALKNSGYKFTANWFNQCAYWPNLFNTRGWLQGNIPLKILEVGSWEGLSTCWMLENISAHIDSKIFSVDLFEKVEDMNGFHTEDSTFFDYFLHNIEIAGGKNKVEVCKGYSSKVLPNLMKEHAASFDLVYVDGSHEAPYVLIDAIHAFSLVKQEGIIIFDDYKLVRRNENPGKAINAFLDIFNEFKNRLKVLYTGGQIALEKVED
jgi:FkbM family methyltransferase